MEIKKESVKKVEKNSKKGQEFIKQIAISIFIFALVLFIYGRFNSNSPVKTVSVTEFVSLVNSGEIKEIVSAQEVVKATSNSGVKYEAVKERGTPVYELLTAFGVSTTTIASTTITVNNELGKAVFFSMLPTLLMFLLLLYIGYSFLRGMKQGGMQAMTFGKTKAKVIMPDDTKEKITFNDVAGEHEAKEELKEIVEFLKTPEKFLALGAKIPKGVLLMGAPGTGKTLLARAVAGEANVPFFHLSGSEFEEMFVGVGASRVRDLFEMAKTHSPSIIFIDEVDAVGKSRDVGVGGHGEAREQTLNQILVEMDGFEKSENVIIIAATNRPDVLDKALLRPGRFDRRITLDLPDRKDRLAILEVHAKNKKLANDVDLKIIAERTPGFSGADLMSIVNEGAIMAARGDSKEISQAHLISSIEKVMLGPERKSHILSDEEKRVTAYHEAGHALVASCLPNADPVHKISIISRGNAGGYTLKLPIDDRRLQTKMAYLDDIAMTLGGYVAEETVIGDITTGPSNDLQVATIMARDMVMKYGMSRLGLIAYQPTGQFAGRSGYYGPDYSSAYGEKIDEEVKRIVDEAFARARTIVLSKREALDAIAERLLEVENIEQTEYEKLIEGFGIAPKRSVKKSESK